MNKQTGMTLLEVLVALAIFSLAGLTLLQTTAQQARNAGMMKEKMLASWLADNQQVRLHLNKLWPEKSATGASVTYAGEEWYLSWQGVIQSSASYGRWILKCGAINKIPRRYFLYAATWCTNEPLPRTRFYAAGNATRISHFCGVESQRFPDITGGDAQ